MRVVASFALLLFTVVTVLASDRYSVASGNWNATSTWSSSSGGAPGASYPVDGDVVYIENGNTITVTADAASTSITFTGVGATITVNSSFSVSISGSITLNKQVNSNTGCTISGAGTLSCASLAVGSGTNPPPGDFGGNTRTHTFTTSINELNISGNLTVNGYYTLISYLRNGIFNLESGTLTIGGSLVMNAALFSTTTFSMASGVQSGTLIFNGSSPVSVSGAGTKTFNFNGTSSIVKYSLSGAQTVYASAYNGLTLAGSGTKTLTSVTVNGVLSMEGTATASTTPTFGASSTLRYKGSSSQTTGSELPATVSGSGGVVIDNASGVALNSSLTVNNILTLTSGALSIASNTLSIANSGNISYGGGSITGGSASNLIIGSGSDITLNAIEGGLNNLNISRNISMTTDLVIGGTLTLTSGTFSVGANTLTLNGPSIAGTPSNLATTSSSSLVFGGTTASVMIPSGVANLNSLSVSNSNVVGLQSSLTVSGTFNPSGAGLSIGANTLTLNGQINCGTLTGGGSSNLIIGGSGSASLPAVTLNNLSINRSVALCGNLTVGGTLTLTSGALSIGAHALTISDGGSISYAGGSITGGTSSDLTIGTGADLTFNTISGGLNNMTSLRNITLGADLSINGTLTLTSGSFTLGAYALTLNGPAISGTPSNLTTSSSSSLIFGGSSSSVAIPSTVTNLYSLTINNSSGVTMNSNITLAATGVLTLNTGILQAGSYILSVANTNPSAAIQWTAGSFINVSTGGLERTLAQNLSGSGNNFLFPIGEGSAFKGLNIIDVNTGAAGPILRASVAASGATTGDGVTIGPVDQRYWYLGNMNGGNFTSARVELYESGLVQSKTIGMAPAATGTYTAIGGSSSSSSVTSGIVLNPGPYFCIGTKLNTTYYSIQTANWNSSATWSLSSGGTAGIGTPQTGDFVIIENPAVVTVTTDAACASVTFSGANAGLTVNASVTLNVSGNINQTKRANGASTTMISGEGTVLCSNVIIGTAANSPTGDNTTRVHRINSTVSTFNISGNITINSYFAATNRIRNGGFYLQSGTLAVAGTIETSNADANNTSTYSMTTGDESGTLILTGSVPFSESGTGTSNMRFNGVTATVIYSGTVDQTPSTDAAYNNITLSGSGIKTISGVIVNGILSLEGTAATSGNPTYRTNSTLQYKGSASQTTGSELPATFTGTGGIIIDNPGNVVLNSNLTINSSLNFINGRITTGANTLTIASGATLTGAGSANYVNGNLKKAIAASTASVTFEIGDAAAYTPVTLEFTGTTNGFGDITAYTTPTDHPSIGTSAVTSAFSVNRYWTLTNNNVTGFTSCTATFTFMNSDKDSNAEYDYFIMEKYLSSAWSSPLVGTKTSTTIQATGLTTFGDFQAGNYLAEFRSTSSGDWNQTSTWETLVGTTWRTAPSVPDLATISVTVQSPNIVTNNTSTTIGKLIVDTGATLILDADLVISDGTGTDMSINGTLNSGGIHTVSGAGSFELGSSATIVIGSPDGITSSGSTGNIQTASRTFDSGASYIYNGNSTQITGNGLPASINNLTINNATGVSLSGSTTIYGVLSLTSGAFVPGASTLTFHTSDNPIVRTSGTITTNASSDLSFGSPGNTGGAAFAIPSGTFTTAPEINNLTIYRTNSLTLNNQVMSVNGIVLANGPLNTNDNLILLSTSGGTALIDGSGTGTVTGNVTMQRYLPSGFGYKYFSSPFQAATVSEFADDINLAASFTTFYKYDENRTSSGWVNYKTGTNTLYPMSGYAVNFGSNAAPNTADVTGAVNNGALSVTLYNHNNTYTKGFNLVGNPYPSPINWNAGSGWTKTNIDNALYYFKAGTTDQYVGTNSTYINGVSSDGLATNVIPSMQGFFVHVTDGPPWPVTATLGMNNSVRITDKTHSFIKGGEESDISLLRVTATYTDNQGSPDPFVIYYSEKADVEFNNQLDALKLLNTDLKVPNLYAVTPSGSKLSIDALPFNSETDFSVPLGLKANKEGTIAFKVRDIEGIYSQMRIFLLDKVTGTEQELLNEREYKVSLGTGEYLNRFYLNFYSLTTDIPESTGPVNEMFSIYSTHGVLKAEINQLQGPDGTVMITNLLGQTLFSYKIHETGYHEFNTGIKDGIYIVTFVSGNTRSSKKLVIKN